MDTDKLIRHDHAAEQFDETLKQRLNILSKERVQKLQLFHACALYEAGKQHREDGDWAEAKKCFQAAKKTRTLPPDLEKKNATYWKE